MDSSASYKTLLTMSATELKSARSIIMSIAHQVNASSKDISWAMQPADGLSWDLVNKDFLNSFRIGFNISSTMKIN